MCLIIHSGTFDPGGKILAWGEVGPGEAKRMDGGKLKPNLLATRFTLPLRQFVSK